LRRNDVRRAFSACCFRLHGVGCTGFNTSRCKQKPFCLLSFVLAYTCARIFDERDVDAVSLFPLTSVSCIIHYPCVMEHKVGCSRRGRHLRWPHLPPRPSLLDCSSVPCQRCHLFIRVSTSLLPSLLRVRNLFGVPHPPVAFSWYAVPVLMCKKTAHPYPHPHPHPHTQTHPHPPTHTHHSTNGAKTLQCCLLHVSTYLYQSTRHMTK
jgi:hypothetical protein